ncbi:MAG: AAA family ATPase [Campylobacterales bacterium]|nr:AAA family ATPase [Campylobacterales bacterium]
MTEPLSFSALYRTCDPKGLSFETTQELEPLSEIIGQDSALAAVDFGINIAQEGYNLYAMGPSGSGKHSLITAFLREKASGEPRPDDWCYVNNFKDHRVPIAIKMPPGDCIRFKDDVAECIELLKTILPTVFESNEYRNTREAINQKYIGMQADIFQNLQKEAEKHGVAMNAATPSRITFVPIVEGKILSAEEFKAISGKEKEELNAKLNAFEAIVKDSLRKVSQLSKSLQKELMALDRKTTADTVETLLEELRETYSEIPKISAYLDALQYDIIKNVQDFLVKPDEMEMPPFMREYVTPSFRRYQVNVLMAHDENGGAPLVYEDNPTYQNLVGRIEHVSQMGTLLTDFTMIKPGALHKANGGYLILDARKLLIEPFAWEALKRVLRSKEIRIESITQQYSLIDTTTLEPEAIPVSVKVVLIGERILYYFLYHYDPDFKELFKVSADFEEDMPGTGENIRLYAQMIGTIAQKSSLFPLSAEAVARVIEHSTREAQDNEKISTHIATLADLLKEADYWTRKAGRSVTEKSDIETALGAQQERMNRIQKKLYEQIAEGVILINTEGRAIGQINALTYISMGGHRFGVPSRITARTRLGKGEVIDIERKAELGGPIHSKGVMILSSYLGSTYAKEAPFHLFASLVFEQSYAKIEGDSASSTELYAVLSSLSELPVAQNIAVTGSVNQFGEIQAIGGVNEKIEGFFDVCMHRNPGGEYGVIIPRANIRHLMLKKEVVEAAKEGRFKIYAVETIGEGIEILTGVEAGVADGEGNYPAGSVNGRVMARLKSFTKTMQEYGKSMTKE